MIFYHGTSLKNWKKIQEEGILFGVRDICDKNGNLKKKVDRCTYLSQYKAESECYGKVILEVEYDPFKNKKMNNYVEDCWQMRVYEPIPLSNIKRIK